MNELTRSIQKEIQKVIRGKDEVIEQILMAILAGGHVLLEDVPGVGKTTLAMAFSKVLGIQSGRVQFTSDTMPSDIIGFSVYDQQTGSLRYKPGAVMTNLLLADEINRTSSKTQSALLEAMEERSVTVDGVTHPLPEPFFVLATQNPVGSAGTQLLPNAQLDRFLLQLSVGYPDLASQIELMKDRHHANPLDAVRPQTNPETLQTLIKAAADVHISDLIYTYCAQLAEATRAHPYVRLGISPRGALSLCRTAKAHAFLQDRDYVIPADLKAVFVPVAAHRLILDHRAKLHELSARSILEEILQAVPAPAAQTPSFQ